MTIQKRPPAAQSDLLSPVRENLQTFKTHAEWHSWVQSSLPRPSPAPDAPFVLDLFAGCGGLGLGFEAAGFRTLGFEMKRHAAASYAANLHGHCETIKLDVGEPVPTEPVDLIIGGPPCQPFSAIGYQRGKLDPRDGFPIFLDAVRRLKPKLAIIENVRGLLYRNRDYLLAASAELKKFGYQVDARLLNARDYGAPQNRERVVVVAHQGTWEWPEPIVAEPVTAGIALGPTAHEVPLGAKFLTASMDRYIAEYERKSNCVNPRDLHLHKPARTLTCRNLGAATADMQRIKLPDGRRRMLTIREGARLQGFPEWFEFSGNDYDQAEQIGNAVSPLMALALAKQARLALERTMSKGVQLAPSQVSLLAETPAQIKIRQALTLLGDVGLNLRELTPTVRDRVALALLAVAGLRPEDPWSSAVSYLEDKVSPTLSQRKILHFWNEHYGTKLKDSSYDDVKRRALIHLEGYQLVVAGAKNPNAAINDSTRGHALSLEGLELVRAYGSSEWPQALARFKEAVPHLLKADAERRRRTLVPVSLPGAGELRLTPGEHNTLQAAIITQFLGGFSDDAKVLYIADAAKKKGEFSAERVHKDEETLNSLVPV